MTTTESEPVENTRRVRGWIAALLTFLGWGVGFYYARQTRTAVWLVLANFLIGLVLGGGFLAYLVVAGALPSFMASEQARLYLDLSSFLVTAAVAVFAWISTARHPYVRQGRPVRLLGYLAILVLPLLISLSAAFAIRWFEFQPFRIPGAAMAPTLNVGDYVLASKTAYGYGPYTTAPLVGLMRRDPNERRAPQRGDLAVFRPTHEPDRDFVKRVIGLPGDRVQMIDGVLYLNGEALNRERLADVTVIGYDGEQFVAAYRETLPNGVSYVVLDAGETELDNTREFHVPERHYFVMGDHRDNSDDSRRSIGMVPVENFVGRVDRIIRGPGGAEP